MTENNGKIWNATDPEEDYEKDYYVDFPRKAIIENRRPSKKDKVSHLKIGDKKRITLRTGTIIFQIRDITDNEIIFDWEGY